MAWESLPPSPRRDALAGGGGSMWQWGRAGHALVWLLIALALHRGGPAGRAAGGEVVQLRPPLRDGDRWGRSLRPDAPKTCGEPPDAPLPDAVQVPRIGLLGELQRGWTAMDFSERSHRGWVAEGHPGRGGSEH